MNLDGNDYMVDVIIPAYNTYDYISETLNSILNQTYVDKINVYVIDDCSEKRYGDICDRYIDKMSINLIELGKNMGPGFARQYGVDISSSKYIVFIDSDDIFLDNDSIERMVMAMENNNYDALSAKMTEDYFGKISSCFVGFDTIHAKIYSRKFLNNKKIRFPYNYNSEDIAFNNLVLLSTENIGQLDCNVYLYRRRKNSLTQNDSFDEEKHIKTYCDNLLYTINEAKKNNVDKRYLSMLLRSTYSYFMWYFMSQSSIDDCAINNIYSLIKFYDEYEKFYDDNVGCMWLKYWINVVRSNYLPDDFDNFIEFCRFNYKKSSNL